VTSTSAAASKERVLASRIAKPKSAPHFRLKSIDGKTISLADLKGKVTVLNFWGVWCGWCVREMPDFATLARRYAGDPHVRIVTVDTDDDPDTVKKWMAEKKYDFPVLLDDGWARRSGISAFPTTWFLDKQGRIAFKKIGWTEKLVDQFSWRIDVLKE
jgi:thiol-disulfide isomerase/thioredoxin